MKYSKYPSYRDSGVEWLGKIPEHWKQMKMSLLAKFITDFVSSGSFKSLKENIIYLDEPNHAMLVRTTDLSNKRNVGKVYINKSAYDFLSNSNLFGGEIILPNIGSVGEVYLYNPLYKNSTLAPNAIMLDMKGSNRYYFYLFQDNKINATLKLIGNEAIQVKFNKTQLRGLVVHTPPFQEQQSIANYLDMVTVKIDTLIEKQTKLIELLREKRQVLISTAVTRGLDNTVAMKDSGVEWLGKIPEHWEVCQFRRIMKKLEQGWSPEASNIPAEKNEVGVIKLSAIKKGKFIPEQNKKLPKEMVSNKALFIKDGDLLLTRANTPSLVGDTCIVNEVAKRKLILCDIVYRITLESLFFQNFYMYWFLSKNGRTQIQMDARGSSMTMAKVSQEHIKSWLVVLPSYNEQKRIVEHIEVITSKIESLINKSTKAIDLLKEKRTALISSAVTGKIDVREIA